VDFCHPVVTKQSSVQRKIAWYGLCSLYNFERFRQILACRKLAGGEKNPPPSSCGVLRHVLYRPTLKNAQHNFGYILWNAPLTAAYCQLSTMQRAHMYFF
jgi:hypothetical protein